MRPGNRKGGHYLITDVLRSHDLLGKYRTIFKIDMHLNDLVQLRLLNQNISKPIAAQVSEIFSHMGALQAQDFAMVRWAVGLRLPGSTDSQIVAALDKGDILRTHVLRPTWHLVSARDIHWMLDLTRERIKTRLKGWHPERRLTERSIVESRGIIAEALADVPFLSRDVLKQAFADHKIPLNDNITSNLLMRAEADGLICSGPIWDNQQTYALLSKRVPDKMTLTREAALAELAKRYFTSHGPATLNDFIWWSGLLQKDARSGLEMNAATLVSEKIGESVFWMSVNQPNYTEMDQIAYLLPAFDEFIVSYADRSAILKSEQQKKLISNNGIFWPMVVVNGEVLGRWKRTQKSDTVQVVVSLFRKPSKTVAAKIEHAAQRFAHFVEKSLRFDIELIE